MPKYKVLENGHPAVRNGWPKCEYNTFEEAKAYADKWLGAWRLDNYVLNQPEDFNGYGDTIEIRVCTPC